MLNIENNRCQVQQCHITYYTFPNIHIRYTEVEVYKIEKKGVEGKLCRLCLADVLRISVLRFVCVVKILIEFINDACIQNIP